MVWIARRHTLFGLAAALAGCAAAPARALATQAVAPGVHVVAGSGGSADENNLGRIGNLGFVVGPEGVLVVDTGTSFAHGQALLAAIGALTDRPVRLAVVTHTQPEFLFGGTAFRERGIPVVMHARCAGLMASRCETCLKRLRETVGEAPFAGTAMYRPDRVFETTQRVDEIGRAVVLRYFGPSSGPGDIAVHDEASGTLFAGGLLDAGRVPDIQDSDLEGWKRALRELRALPITRIVPGHGPVSPPSLIDVVERYLVQLEQRTRRFVADGGSLLDVGDAIDLPEFAAWDQYATVHRRNAAIAFLRFERELLFR